MLIEDFNHTIDLWIKGLEQYDFIQLCAKPSPNGWSLGQVYMHLIDETNYYIQQIKICVSNNDNINKEAAPAAKAMFLNNEFPDVVIEGAASNAQTPQPRNKQQLMNGLMNLKDEMQEVEILISTSPFKGKTKHPGLHYFNAEEWLQFAEMHLRHHLRQKKRIDDFLKINR
ncbi:MAG: DinB family protein [Segetibacter sp.]|nr:DinB family protein [Segetibacter sp.]